jgi:hypothetical protein
MTFNLDPINESLASIAETQDPDLIIDIIDTVAEGDRDLAIELLRDIIEASEGI